MPAVPAEATIEGDRLTVTFERQIGEYADHTTVRAHVGVTLAPAAEDESVVEYQERVAKAIAGLALPLKEAVYTELGIEYEFDGDGYVHEHVKPVTQRVTPSAPSAPQAPSGAPVRSNSKVKVMEKDAPTAAEGKKYGRIDPATAKPWVDPAAIAAAEAGGADTLWTGVTNGRRWYRFNDELWNKPQDEAPATPADDEPF